MIGQYLTIHGDVISHVNISNVAVEDGGEYSCTAENRAGKVTHSARLNVYGNRSVLYQIEKDNNNMFLVIPNATLNIYL